MDKTEVRNICDIVDFNNVLGQDRINFMGISELITDSIDFDRIRKFWEDYPKWVIFFWLIYTIKEFYESCFKVYYK